MAGPAEETCVMMKDLRDGTDREELATSAADHGLTAFLLFRRPPVGLVVLLSGLPMMLAGWLLLSPDIMLARQNVMDLLFNLAGAWQFQVGRAQHIDFHEAVGPLNFLLTLAGFRLIGVSPFAFLAGEMLAALGLFAAAVAVAARRLPLAAAATFVLFIGLPAMMPTNVGHPPDVFTFAMSYNRYGWSSIAVLCLLLFGPPRWSPTRDGIDIACGFLLLLAMFYLKITYFLVGVGALGLALLISDHIQTRCRAWIAVGLLVAGNALAPHSHGYLADLRWAIDSGLPSTGPTRVLMEGVLGNSMELAVYGAGFLAACWLWRQGLASWRLPIAALFLIGAAIMLFTQNTQMRGLPLGTVTLFMLYGALLPHRDLVGPMVLVILLLVPAQTALTAAGTTAAYFLRAVPSAELLIATETNIRGLAVPMRSENGHSLRPQTIYFAGLMEAAALFSTGHHKPGRIQLLDRVNPLPFMLGFDPPRGGDLFWEPTAPPRPVEEVLGDADYVLVPTQSSSAPVFTQAVHARFTPYLTRFFPLREETDRWILYSRAAPAPTAAHPASGP
jgi:hypothetical protein